MFGEMQATNRAIQRRRDEENRISAFRATVEEDKSRSKLAIWEQKTDAAIKKNQIKNITYNLQNMNKLKLVERQQKLKALLTREDEQYREELVGMQETSADKAKRMVSYARELKNKREEERKAFASEQLERQWRLGCDDLRDIEGIKFRNYCLAQVTDQRRELVMRREKDREEEEKWAAQWEQERMKKVEREDREQRERKAFSYETKMDLLNQMRETRESEVNRLKEQEAERAKFRQHLADEDKAAREEAARRMQMREQEMANILADNEKYLEAKAIQQKLQREQEMRDLATVAEAQAADEAGKAAAKEKMRQEMIAYGEYLNERKAEEKAVEKELEKLCEEEMERANSKRDMQWMREKMARENLMKDVYEGRYEQVKKKEEEQYQQEMKIYYERQAMDKEIAEATKQEEEEERKLKETQQIRYRELNNQTQHIRNRRDLEKKQVLHEEQLALQAERQHQAYLARERKRFETAQYAYEPKYYGKRVA